MYIYIYMEYRFDIIVRDIRYDNMYIHLKTHKYVMYIYTLQHTATHCNTLQIFGYMCKRTRTLRAHV